MSRAWGLNFHSGRNQVWIETSKRQHEVKRQHELKATKFEIGKRQIEKTVISLVKVKTLGKKIFGKECV